jgi:hypothetical protein
MTVVKNSATENRNKHSSSCDRERIAQHSDTDAYACSCAGNRRGALTMILTLTCLWP